MLIYLIGLWTVDCGPWTSQSLMPDNTLKSDLHRLQPPLRIQRRFVLIDPETELRNTLAVRNDLAQVLVGGYFLAFFNGNVFKAGVYGKIIAVVNEHRAAYAGGKGY